MAGELAATPRGEIADATAAGVSLTRPESLFLTRLVDPFSPPPDASDEELERRGAAIGLRPEDVSYIREWVMNHGAHWLTCERCDLDTREGARVFRNPIVRRIINAAAELGYCVGTSALKEELEDFFTQRVRSPYLPEALRDAAADKLAKLKGFYPDSKDKGAGGVAVQVVVMNPYSTEGKRG